MGLRESPISDEGDRRGVVGESAANQSTCQQSVASARLREMSLLHGFDTHAVDRRFTSRSSEDAQGLP